MNAQSDMFMDLARTQKINLALTLIGAVVFAVLFLYMKTSPSDFDQRTRNFAISKIEKKVGEQVSSVAQSESVDRVSEFAGRFSEKLQSEIDDARKSWTMVSTFLSPTYLLQRVS